MLASDPDEMLRAAGFVELRRLCKKFGTDVPYRGGLDGGFDFDGKKVPFLAPAKGIFRAARQRGPAALSINTSRKSKYDDASTSSGFSYAYRSGSIDQPDNRALRAAGDIGAPLVYFIGTRPGWYYPIFPAYVIADHPQGNHVIVGVGAVKGIVPSDQATDGLPDEVKRVWSFRETRIRVHQARFRGMVLPAYESQCAICRLKEERLLDAAHIIPDSDPDGAAAIHNGLSLCSIHHRAFDEDLVGISPDYEVRVAERLLDDHDGPMLDLLKTFHRRSLLLPSRTNHRPSQEHLARRFEMFRMAS